MAYQDKAKSAGRIPCIFIEQDMDWCSRTYGEGLCEAAIGVTGTIKCFNTYATCQDKANWDKTTKTYRYCTANAALPVGVQAYPLIKDKGVQFTPQVLTPGKGLGVRGSVTVKMTDMPFSDAGVDPYLSSRSYNPMEQGTYWGKFRARNPFYLGRPLRVLTGYIDPDNFSWDDFQTREYVIDSFKGPSRDGEVEWIAKDVLALADDKKAVCPRHSTGQLVADISASDTSFTLVPVGIGNAEYPASGRIVIGGEGMDFTRSGDVCTVTRDVYNTGAKEHKASDTVQLVKRWVNADIQDIIYELFTDYTPGFKPAWITKDDWDAERDAFLPGSWSADIVEPTGVNTLIGELNEQGTCFNWWDEIAQKVRFKALRKPDENIDTLSDEDHNLFRSVNLTDDMSARVSQVVVHFDRIDPTKKLDEVSNYRQHYVGPDTESSGPNEYGINSIKTVFSRWFTNASLGRVQALSETMLKRFTDPPRTLTYKLDASKAQAVGDVFWASTRGIQDVTGARGRANMMVIESREIEAGTTYELKAQENIWNPRIQDNTNLRVYISRDEVNVNLYDRFVSEYGTPIAGQSVEFIVLPGVVVGGDAAAVGGVNLANYTGVFREKQGRYGYAGYHVRDTAVYMHPLIRQSIGVRRKFDVGAAYENDGIYYELMSTLWEVPPTYAIDTGVWPAGVTLNLVISPGAYVLGEAGTPSVHVGSTGGTGYQGLYILASGTVRTLGIPSDGGHALLVQAPITITNRGVIGGGGASGRPYPVCLRPFLDTSAGFYNFGCVGILSGEGAGSNTGKLPAPVPAYVPPDGVRFFFNILNPLRRQAAVGQKLTGGVGAIGRFVANNYYTWDPSTYDAAAGNGGAIAAGAGVTGITTIYQSTTGFHDFPTRAWVSGLAGKAVVGNSNVTWAVTGTRHGAIES